MTARQLKAQLENDPDRYSETVTASIKSDMVRQIVAPLVAKLEAALARARGDAFEAMYNIEEELGERLIEAGREPIGSGLATALVENSFEELDGVLRDLMDPEPIKEKIETYFDSFATADFFQELHELSHRRNVESPANDRLQLLETPALPECAAVLHRAEERIVEALHGVAAARRRGVCRIGNHSKAEHRGKSRGFPHRRFRYDRLPHSLVLLIASIVVAAGFVDPSVAAHCRSARIRSRRFCSCAGGSAAPTGPG